MENTPRRKVNVKFKEQSACLPCRDLTLLPINNNFQVDSVSTDTTSSLRQEWGRLKKREKELDEELLTIQGVCDSAEVQSNMELLHTYNDVKDAAQIVLGSLARLQGLTVTEVHEQFGLNYVNNEADKPSEKKS